MGTAVLHRGKEAEDTGREDAVTCGVPGGTSPGGAAPCAPCRRSPAAHPTVPFTAPGQQNVNFTQLQSAKSTHPTCSQGFREISQPSLNSSVFLKCTVTNFSVTVCSMPSASHEKVKPELLVLHNSPQNSNAWKSFTRNTYEPGAKSHLRNISNL